MEYRRRRTGTRRRTAYRSSFSRQRETAEENAVFNLLLLLLLTCGLVYLMIGTSFGKKLTHSLVGLGENSSSAAPLFIKTPDTSTNKESSSQLLGGELINEEMTLPKLNMFALQIGDYSSEENAKGLVASLKSLGAAGYCLKYKAGIKVLASCYDTEAAASSVCKRLNEQGYECTILPIEQDDVKIRATAEKQQLETLKRSIELAYGLISSLNEEVLRFDGEERGVEYGIAVGKEMLESIASMRAELESVREKNGVCDLIKDYYISVSGAFSRFASTSTKNRVELSGMLKYLQIETIDLYRNLLVSIASFEQHT